MDEIFIHHIAPD